MADQSSFNLSAQASGPVECLGRTFPSDQARREHYLKLLAAKLKDPEFRRIEGFPAGTDDAILALSNPPYFTACPNPWIGEFLKTYGAPYDPKQAYHREPFASDVGDGKNHPIYNAHSYQGMAEFSLLSLEEMNELPYPLMDEACVFSYADGCPTGQKFPQLQVWTSRGCPHKCVWCCWPATMTGNDPDGTKARKVRAHSPDWLEGMLRHRLAEAYKDENAYKCIYLDDDTLNLTEKHTLNVCAVMKRIGLPWSAMCRADTISREAWQAMKDAGCFGVKLGFESGSQRVIDQIINKKLNLVEAAETARFLRSIGMTVHGTFTIGMPGETLAEQQMTRDFIQGLYATGAIDTHQLSGTAVIEGTPMANMLHSHEVLPKYPGATPDKDYHVESDGQAKIEHMKKSLT